MAFPPGATVGNIAKEDDSKFTDEDLQKLNDAKLPFGGSEAIFSKMTGEYNPHEQISRRGLTLSRR